MKKRFLTAVIVIGVFVILICQIFALKIVRGISMLPTLKDGDIIIANKQAYGWHLFADGSAILFRKPIAKHDIVLVKLDEQLVVKRVVLTSGERIQVTDYNDTHFLCLDSACIKLDGQGYQNITAQGTVTRVPDGYVLVLGDNLRASEDSRNYGFVCEKSVIAKVLK